MRRWILALAIALFAAAPGARAQPTNAAIAAPTPRDVTIRVTQAQSGQTIVVPIEARFAVELVGIPTAGYVWAPVEMPAFLTRAGEATGPTSSAQMQRGFTGGNHWEVLMFSALEPGRGELWIAQKRPWETGVEPAAVFMVTIEAR